MNLTEGLDGASSPAAASIVPDDVRQAAAADATDSLPPAGASMGAGGAASSAPAPAAPSAADFDQDARELVEFTWACFSPLYPSLTPIYTAEVRARIAGAAAPVMRKYNFDLAFLGPELTLTIVLLPLVVPTYQAISNDRKATKAAAPAPAAPAGVNASADLAREGERGAGAAAAATETPLTRFPGLTLVPT